MSPNAGNAPIIACKGIPSRVDTSYSSKPDYDVAVAYALERLRNELLPELTYYDAEDAEGDCLPLALRLAQLSTRPKSNLLLVSYCLNGHEDRWLLNLADTSSLAGFQFCREMSDQVNG